MVTVPTPATNPIPSTSAIQERKQTAPSPPGERALLFTCWESIELRLHPSDLQEPERYRQRLGAWLLRQR